MKITDHFDSDEFTCHDGISYPLDNAEDGSGIPTGWTVPAGSPNTWQFSRLLPLCLMNEVIRQAAIEKYGLSEEDAGLIIDSGYRDEEYDEKIYNAHVEAYGDDGLVAKASTSIHPKGGANDLRHKKLTPLQLYTLILELYEAGKLPYIGGVGKYPSFVHVDVRPRSAKGQHLAMWGGVRPSNIA
jgi:hypothetical protein